MIGWQLTKKSTEWWIMNDTTMIRRSPPFWYSRSQWLWWFCLFHSWCWSWMKKVAILSSPSRPLLLSVLWWAPFFFAGFLSFSGEPLSSFTSSSDVIVLKSFFEMPISYSSCFHNTKCFAFSSNFQHHFHFPGCQFISIILICFLYQICEKLVIKKSPLIMSHQNCYRYLISTICGPSCPPSPDVVVDILFWIGECSRLFAQNDQTLCAW